FHSRGSSPEIIRSAWMGFSFNWLGESFFYRPDRGQSPLPCPHCLYLAEKLYPPVQGRDAVLGIVAVAVIPDGTRKASHEAVEQALGGGKADINMKRVDQGALAGQFQAAAQLFHFRREFAFQIIDGGFAEHPDSQLAAAPQYAE